MEKSHYIEIIKKYLKGIVLAVVEKLNGKEEGLPPKYRFREMLTLKFSVTGKWETMVKNYRNIKADLVSMDSPLPLKTRPSLGVASGDIQKSGMRKQLNETQMTALQTMEALGLFKEMIKELFDDAIACITGMYENVEYMFLYGLSHGEVLVKDDENVGTATRLDFGYLDKNKFGVKSDWSDTENSKPLDDIERIATESKGNARILMMDRKTSNLLRSSKQVRLAVAANSGLIAGGSDAVRPSLAAVNGYLMAEYRISIDVVERTMEAEKDGISTELTPWKDGVIVAIPGNNVGDLVYARTAEDNARVEGISYEKPTDWMLLSMYRKNEPAVSEHTRIQGRVMPVISNVGKIFILDTKTIEA